MPFQIVLMSDISRRLHGKGMGVYRLANHLRMFGYSVKVIHAWLRITDEQFQALCEKYISDETLLFGFGATVVADLDASKFFGMDDQQAESRFQWMRQRWPNLAMALGGAQVTGARDHHLKRFDYFDYAIKGQGETAILHLLDHITRKKRIVFVDNANPKILTDKIYPFEHFNTTFNTFLEDDAIQPGEGLPIEIARGCIFKCKFCGYDLLGKKLGDFVKQSNIMRDELLRNYEMYGTTDYYVADETINDSEEKVDMLLESVQNLPFKPTFGGFLRLDMLWKFPNMIPKLQEWGLEACSFGIETVNDASGKAVGKGLGVRRIEEALDRCHEVWKDKVYVNASFILGLKHDGPKSAEELDAWLEKQYQARKLHTVFVKPLYIMPEAGTSYIDLNYAEHGYRSMGTTEMFEHSLGGDRSVLSGDLLIWTTDKYDFLQANRDANRIHDKINSRKLCSGSIAKHNMAYIKSLLPPELKSQLVGCLVHDQGFKGMTLKESSDLIRDLVDQHKARYVQALLN